ncbi:MAG: EamA family transporter [Thermaerobacter sp.]|nr:EamA family transporter [Thermaerobacter sp.]
MVAFGVDGGAPETVQRPRTASTVRLHRLKGFTMVLVGAVLWGVSGTAAQVLFHRDGFQPGWLVTVRMSAAGFVLLAFVAVQQGLARTLAIWRHGRDAVKIGIFGLGGLLGVQYTYFASIQRGNAAVGTMLRYLGPLFITVYLAWRQRRLPTRPQIAAVSLALVGAALLITNGNLQGLTVSPWAVFWGLLSALALAFYSLYPQGLIVQYGAATVVGWAMLVGGLGMSVIAPPWAFVGQTSIAAWGLVAFVVLLGTLVAFYLYIASLQYISPAEAGVLTSGEPLSAALIAVTVLHVRMGWVGMIGAICIVSTVTVLASMRPDV